MNTNVKTHGPMIKKTWKSKMLLTLDKLLRSLYPRWLNKWIFNHLDYEEKKEEILGG